MYNRAEILLSILNENAVVQTEPEDSDATLRHGGKISKDELAIMVARLSKDVSKADQASTLYKRAMSATDEFKQLYFLNRLTTKDKTSAKNKTISMMRKETTNIAHSTDLEGFSDSYTAPKAGGQFTITIQTPEEIIEVDSVVKKLFSMIESNEQFQNTENPDPNVGKAFKKVFGKPGIVAELQVVMTYFIMVSGIDKFMSTDLKYGPFLEKICSDLDISLQVSSDFKGYNPLKPSANSTRPKGLDKLLKALKIKDTSAFRKFNAWLNSKDLWKDLGVLDESLNLNEENDGMTQALNTFVTGYLKGILKMTGEDLYKITYLLLFAAKRRKLSIYKLIGSRYSNNLSKMAKAITDGIIIKDKRQTNYFQLLLNQVMPAFQ